MTLDKIIERFENNAEFERQNGNLQGCLDFRQLAEWLKKLQAYEEAREEIARKRDSGQWSEPVVFGLNHAIYIIDKHLMEVNDDDS